MSFDYDKYLRLDKFPTIFCPGCGDGIILKAALRAIDHIGLDKDQVMMVSGIGCSSRTSGYVDVKQSVQVVKAGLNFRIYSSDW